MKKSSLRGSSILKKKTEHLISTELEEEMVMMNLENGDYFGLDGVSLTIWNMLDNEISFSTLKNQLMEKYSISKEQCDIESAEFLDSLIQHGMLTIS